MDAPHREIDRLKEKYGAKAIEAAQRLRPRDFPEQIAWRDELDQNYARLWLDFTYGGLFTRGVLDDRTRILVLIGQCVVLGEMEELENQIHSGLANGATPREVLEVILQATVYGGYPKVDRAARIFRRIMVEMGRLEEITGTQLPIEGPERSLEEDQPTWRVPDERFPRREEMMRKYGWQGIGTGLRLQPHHHVRRIGILDRIDQHYLKLWLDFIYAGMYPRGVLDDKTRVLVMVGECVAMDEMIQADNHMRGALMLGATPREVLEVLVQTTAFVGMPKSLKAVDLLDRILSEQDRGYQLTATQLPLDR